MAPPAAALDPADSSWAWVWAIADELAYWWEKDQGDVTVHSGSPVTSVAGGWAILKEHLIEMVWEWLWPSQ